VESPPGAGLSDLRIYKAAPMQSTKEIFFYPPPHYS
jgi:hypothetical protein